MRTTNRQTKERSADDTFLALDIGGTNVTCGLVSRVGEVLATDIFPTAQGAAGPAELIAIIVKRLKSLWTASDRNHRPAAVAIGAPGWLKPREGVVVTAPNLAGWVGVPITKLMSQALELPARLENDANLYALGEWLAGAGRGSDNQITVTLGTGVGGGLVLNGKLWSGSFTSAAEIGHIPLGPAHTVTCGCGRVGCLETVASASGMARMARLWLESGRETMFGGTVGELNSAVMTELAERGDPMSLHVFREAGTALGQILAGVFNLLSLERAVLGGGGSGAFSFLKEALMDYLEIHLVTAKINEIQVVKGTLGINAPLVGGVALLTADGF
ncbi:MAG: ROK family protein [Deltaproteobacteria bacterium]|jgi:glucokinase|nr:ROK family protein [Deltaproteobacteria bacterium]